MLTPYLLWIKIGAVVLAVGLLIGTGVWVKSVFAERSALRLSEAQAKATTEMYAKAYNDNQKLQEGIANAVKNIRVVSNNYIQSVEDSPPPAVGDGGTVVLVAGGMPKAVSSLPVFGSHSAGRTSTAAEAR